MSYELEWTNKALRELAALDKKLMHRITEKIESCKETPHHFLEKLAGTDFWKTRVGDYRAIVYIDEQKKRLVIVTIGHRKKIYKKKLF